MMKPAMMACQRDKPAFAGFMAGNLRKCRALAPTDTAGLDCVPLGTTAVLAPTQTLCCQSGWAFLDLPLPFVSARQLWSINGGRKKRGVYGPKF